ncbi:MAG TPA: transposase [Polyangia bacterium]|jgi:transposase|nr:transposase [Polyangia bacterium]
MLPRKPYPSDLTDEEYALIEPLLPACNAGKPQGGRPEKHSRREILNAIRYIVRSGGAWRMMPHDLPPWAPRISIFANGAEKIRGIRSTRS